MDGITALLRGEKQRSCGNGKEGDEDAQRRSRKTVLKLSVTENGKGGKSKMIPGG